MAFTNSSGTINKSFKIGPNGVSLTSKAIQNGNISKYLLTNQKDGDKEIYLAYTDSPNPIYDTFIKSSDISSFSYIGNSLNIELRNGTTIVLNQTVGDVVGPDSSNDSSIVLFNGTDGKKIKDSNKTISDSIDDSDTNKINKIPTSNAVIDYVGVLSDALKKRLDGKI